MEKKKDSFFSIDRVKRKVGASGEVLDEEVLSVIAPNKKDCEDMFDKRWKEKD